MDGDADPGTSTKDQVVEAHSTRPTSAPKLKSHPLPPFTINVVRTQIDLEDTINLFTIYAQSLNLDLSFQDFQTEMSTMPGKYSPSSGGELLLARRTTADPDKSPGESLGCVALRSLPSDTNDPSPAVCEMKRLYVTPRARGLGLGKALARQIIEVAETLGYTEVRLDTLASMVAAQAMYRGLGFVDIEPYCFNPVDAVRFLGLKLKKARCND